MTVSRDIDVDSDFVIRLRIVLSRLARQLNLTAGAAGLSPTQAAIFTAIGRRGPVGLSDLAGRENVNASMLSRVVAKLEGAGLAERVVDPQDGRAFIVRLTAKGRATHQQIKREKTEWLLARLHELDPESAQQLLTALPALEELVKVLREPEVTGSGVDSA